MRSKTDRRFAQFCRSGDPDALAEVFDRTAGRLLRIALWLTHQRADAEDLLQRTFLQAIALREQFEPGRRVLPWLMGLMSNQAHLLRRERDRRTRLVPVVERTVDPEAEAVASELTAAVHAVRARLSAPYRDVLELHLEQGFDAREIAARLGRPGGTVRTQLVRALEMLRKQLPSGFVPGMVPLVVQGGGALGGVKASVVAAARRGVGPTSLGGTTGFAIAGGLVAKKVLVVVPVLLLALGVALYPPWSAAPQEPVPVAVAGPVVRAVQRDAASPVAERNVVDTSPPDAAEPTPMERTSFDRSPRRVARWLARFFVVDEDEQPVAGATVSIWAATRVEAYGARVESGNKYSGHFGEPLFELRTDATGCAHEVLDVECVEAAAAKPGLGWTGCLMLSNTRAAAVETKFVLEAPVALRGLVLRADGSPAAGARVLVRASGHSIFQQGEPFAPGPLVAGDDGRFVLMAQRGVGYGLHAEQDGTRSFDETVWIHGDDPEVVLVFPGAITLGGIVVDLDGMPVAKADVSAWREYHIDDPQQAPDWEHLRAETDAHGRFVMAVRRYARYQLIAAAPGHANSKLVWAEPTEVRAHAEVRLELLASTTIRGRVERGDGTAVAGVEVGAQAETGVPRGYTTVANQVDEFQKVERVRTGDDGRFLLTVHPGTSWTLLAWPDTGASRLCVRQRGVAPGRDDVVMRIDDEDLAGCVVRGTVQRADGKPVGAYGVEVFIHDGGRENGGTPVQARIDGEHFTLSPLSRGEQYHVLVTPRDASQPDRRGIGDVAPARTAPFVADRAELAFEFRLEPWGEVPVRVLTADGAAAHRVRVDAWRDLGLGYSNRAMPVDAEGRVVLLRCAPGAHALRVWRDVTVVCKRELQITSGPNPEVVVRLPALVQHR
ncbi:MAG TPA: sigma-70 family RNA polymerase sigma factor [Planctomycetota bacterium]|nr:sigma-70 family RNA polymerase sigma factor [Planctomycetota bacterium]